MVQLVENLQSGRMAVPSKSGVWDVVRRSYLYIKAIAFTSSISYTRRRHLTMKTLFKLCSLRSPTPSAYGTTSLRSPNTSSYVFLLPIVLFIYSISIFSLAQVTFTNAIGQKAAQPGGLRAYSTLHSIGVEWDLEAEHQRGFCGQSARYGCP